MKNLCPVIDDNDIEKKKHRHSVSDIEDFPENIGDYSKPKSGIPKSDLASAVQTSLSKADSALQEHQSLANYVKTDDSRLSDARTPKPHTHTKSDISDFPSIPTVGNGTITITQGGETKGTFTTNQSGDTTIDLDGGGAGEGGSTIEVIVEGTGSDFTFEGEYNSYIVFVNHDGYSNSNDIRILQFTYKDTDSTAHNGHGKEIGGNTSVGYVYMLIENNTIKIQDVWGTKSYTLNLLVLGLK